MYRDFYFKKVISMILISIFVSVISFTESFAFPQNTFYGFQTNNIALGKPTSSNSMSLGYGPFSGNDNNINTYWSAKDSNPNNWWMVDLKYFYSLTGFEVVWREDNKLYKYKIEVSTNKINWYTVVDRTSNDIYSQTQSEDFDAIARYVRITITEVQSELLPGFYEFRVFGTFNSMPGPGIFPPIPVPTSTPTSTPTPISTPTLAPTLVPTSTPTLTSTSTPTSMPIPTPTLTPTIIPTTTAITTLAPESTPISTPLVTPTSSVEPTIQSAVSLSRNTVDTVDYGLVANMGMSQEGEILIPGNIKGQKEIMLVIENSLASNTIYNDISTATDYALFAKNDIYCSGKNISVNASVNANNSFSSTGDTLYVSDVISAKDFSVTTPNMNVDWYVNNFEPVEMPSFYEKLKNEAESNFMVFEPSDFLVSNQKEFPGQPNFFVRYTSHTNTFDITGSGIFTIDSSMYFKGNLKISVPNTNNINSSFLLADGSIDLQGWSLTPDSEKDILNLYSIYGTIKISTNNSYINGIMYAEGIKGNPLYKDEESGDVIIGGSNNTLFGAVVAGKDIFLSGENTTIQYPLDGFSTEMSEYFDVVTTTFDFKKIAKLFIDRFAGTDTMLGVIQFSDSANDNSFVLYDLSKADEIIQLINEVESMEINYTEQNNMGDGLRRAYHTLNNRSESDAAKYIVNVSVTAPNKWTSENSEYKTDNESAVYISGDGTSDSDGKGIGYAKSIGNIIGSSSIETLFINYSNSSSFGTKIEDIAVSAGAKALPDGKHYYTIPSIEDFVSLATGISQSQPTNIILDNVLYEETYPAGVIVTKVPSGMNINPAIYDGNIRYKVSGKLEDIMLTYDGSKYIVNPYSFDVSVKYVSVGKIEYLGSDSKITYTIDYVDAKGDDQTVILEKNFDDMDVNVRWIIDIQ